MRVYFYNESMRYIGNRELDKNETVPINSTTEIANVGDGQEAFLVDGKWVTSNIPPDPILQLSE